MISFDYKPQGVCSRNIHLNLSDDGSKVLGVEFTGGCDGNLKAISKLVEGAPADRVIEVLAGNTCGMIIFFISITPLPIENLNYHRLTLSENNFSQRS